MLINAWRNISDTSPILSNHLAVLDGSTLAPEDIALVDLDYGLSSTESSQVVHTARTRHRWLYFPEMNKDELLLMKQYDSDPAATARYAFHCAFADPQAPKDAPPRESIEVRTVAFFPCDPGAPGGGDLLASHAFPPAAEVAGQLRGHLEHPERWPTETRAWLQEALARDAGRTAEHLMASMVAQNADPGALEGVMPGAPAQLQAEVLELLHRADFAERLLANFGGARRVVEPPPATGAAEGLGSSGAREEGNLS